MAEPSDIYADRLFRPDSPDAILFLDSGWDDPSSSSDDDDHAGSDTASDAASDAATDGRRPSSPWVKPFRRKHEINYYVDERLHDPDRLFKHVRHWANIPPRQWLKIVGERHERYTVETGGSSISGYGAGNSGYDTYTRTVTDFSFKIELTPYLFLPSEYHNP